MNKKNKKSFVSFLIEEFELSQFWVHRATGDADTLIVLRALELAKACIVSVVANYSDVLVMLVSHTTVCA